MKYKKIIALLTAAAIMGALAGCKAGGKPAPEAPGGESVPASFETEAPVESNAQQSVGRVTSVDGTKITIENDDDDTADTIEEIKSGDVVVIGVDKDGSVTSLTVKALNGRFGNRGRNNGNGNGNGSRKNRDNGNRKSGNGDSAEG